MNIKQSYVSISSFFDSWSRFIEIQPRIMEVQDSKLKDSKILIISPPTDRGIKIFAQANVNGESCLLCFSAGLERIAQRYCQKQRIFNLKTCTSKFFEIPYANAYFDVIFANCFFDFCRESDFDKIIREIKRVLNNKGLCFSIYMDFPSTLGEKAWFRFFKIFPSFAQGCHPTNIRPYLIKQSFRLKKDLSIKKFGFPMKYIIAVK